LSPCHLVIGPVNRQGALTGTQGVN
jgi:hypothetical protein